MKLEAVHQKGKIYIFNIITFDWHKDSLDNDHTLANIILFVFDNPDYMHAYIGKCLLTY